MNNSQTVEITVKQLNNLFAIAIKLKALGYTSQLENDFLEDLAISVNNALQPKLEQNDKVDETKNE